MDLRETAIKLAAIYQLNQKVKGILLAGSVSRGWQDRHSDIELHILWAEPPSDK
ncbi:MAG TPA: cytoplasmic protein, partial [Candidatus Angelobacter sp.]|nr:cytoplasmic protein [Candidatus Angelobacter sp.]